MVVNSSVDKRRRTPTSRMDHITAYAMIIPSLALLGVFVLYPLYTSITKSLTDWNFYNSMYVGLKNYTVALRNPTFHRAFQNILLYILFSVPIGVVLPFLFAHCVKRLQGMYGAAIKTALYIPSIISGVISSVIFLFILDYQGGLINNLLRSLGMTRVNFMAQPTSAMLSIVFTGFWGGFGYSTLYQLAGLNNIPDSYYEAAMLDGAGAFKRMIYVTIPCMKNIFLLCLVNGIGGTLMMMELPLLMTNGGPNNATITPVMYIYKMFSDSAVSMGYMLACSIIMMVFSSAFTCIVFFLIKPDKSLE
ncbi:MAG: sugar ABC transporter permease [Oscillospiraceae bacterium]|jgi:ABC-type sugar transport system permease subunit|nr:sugar ABC transporter permease [Oscillospiraceae bacterium]